MSEAFKKDITAIALMSEFGKLTAHEAGLSFVPEANSPLVKIVQKAVAMEREACAQLCEQWDATHPHRLADAIRAREKE